jgi:hypothetical protein
MCRQKFVTALIALVFVSSNAFAKEWYEKSCTATQKDKIGNYYVGGQFNKAHLHIGPDFLSVFSNNNNSKPVTSGKANCDLLSQAIKDVDGGGYTSPNDVTVCLNAAHSYYCQ